MTPQESGHGQGYVVAPDRFDVAMEALILSLLVFSALALGVVEAWSEQVVVSLAGAMALCLSLKFLLHRDAKPVCSWAFLPPALFLLLALFQLIPIPVSLLKLLSPGTVAIKNDLLADLPGAASGGPDFMAITFYPGGTMHDLRLTLVVMVVFVTAVHLYRRPEPIRRLLAVISTLGAGIAILAIVQTITGAEKIYWLVSISTDNANGGTFVNRNNFCQFMNLALGASLGLLLLKISDGLNGIPKTLPNALNWVTGPGARWVWMLVGTIVVGTASVVLSLSRGGVISMLLAGTLLTVIMTTRRRLDGRAWVLVVLALCAFVCVLFFGFDAVFDRLATLEEQHAYLPRWGILQGVLLAWTRFPLVGAGLGTHEVVYPMFDRTTVPTLATFAENEYAQTAEETGIIGFLLVAAFFVAVWIGCRRCIRSGGWHSSVAYGLSFALLAVLVHSVGDFGLHLPANGCLAATYCGVLVSLGSVGRNRQRTPASSGPVPIARRALAPLGLVSVIAIMGWAFISADRARAAETHWKQALAMEEWLEERDWQGRNEDYAELISHAADAVRLHPSKIHYRYSLGVYRWRSISRVEDSETGQVALTAQSREFLRRIVRELHEARVTCPTFGPLYCVVGQLERFFLNEELGSDHIRRGYELAPHNKSVCLVAGLLDAVEDRTEESLVKLERALALDGTLFRDIINLLMKHAKQPKLALRLAEGDADRLSLLAQRLSDSEEYRGLAEVVRKQAIAMIKEQRKAEDAPAGLLARAAYLYRLDGDDEAAAECFSRALEVDYGQVGWRLELARTNAALGRTEEAINQARICLRLRPQMKAALKIIGDLSSREGS